MGNNAEAMYPKIVDQGPENSANKDENSANKDEHRGEASLIILFLTWNSIMVKQE